MENFSSFIAKRLIPELKFKPEKEKAASFAIILEDGQSLSVQDVGEIKERTSLSPLFFVISPKRTLDISRRYARILNGRLAFARGFSEATELISKLSFTVSESLFGSYVSFFAGTPVYIPDGVPILHSFIEETKRCALPDGIFIPYKKNKTEDIGSLTVNCLDFDLAAKKERDLSRSLFICLN